VLQEPDVLQAQEEFLPESSGIIIRPRARRIGKRVAESIDLLLSGKVLNTALGSLHNIPHCAHLTEKSLLLLTEN